MTTAPGKFPVREREGKWEVVIPPSFGVSEEEYVVCNSKDDAQTFANSWLLWGECVFRRSLREEGERVARLIYPDGSSKKRGAAERDTWSL